MTANNPIPNIEDDAVFLQDPKPNRIVIHPDPREDEPPLFASTFAAGMGLALVGVFTFLSVLALVCASVRGI